MTRPDINFSKDDSHAFLPWVIGVMVGLATLLLCLGLTVDGWIIDRHASYENRFSVTMPSTLDDLDGKQKLVRDTLKDVKGVSDVSDISRSKLQAMLSTWLGNADQADDLPLPRVMEITTIKDVTINYKELETKLNIIAPGTSVSSQELWVNSFSQFSAALEALIGILAVLIITSLALTIAFTSRASLKLHSKSVGLLHSIGAEDGYIARQFQQDACMLTLRGTLPGCLLAGFAYWGTGFYMASLESSLLPSFSMNLAHLSLLIAMPAACMMVAWIAARISVTQQLHTTL